MKKKKVISSLVYNKLITLPTSHFKIGSWKIKPRLLICFIQLPHQGNAWFLFVINCFKWPYQIFVYVCNTTGCILINQMQIKILDIVSFIIIKKGIYYESNGVSHVFQSFNGINTTWLLFSSLFNEATCWENFSLSFVLNVHLLSSIKLLRAWQRKNKVQHGFTFSKRITRPYLY